MLVPGLLHGLPKQRARREPAPVDPVVRAPSRKPARAVSGQAPRAVSGLTASGRQL
ncbi:hypothetical protein F8B43_0660 [Methylorubrum populi]|uniref:Uncharacterized protein n=1 Tax=Methylorubrum populi TaxID=223967 RepID=A0A833N2E0_9HYPH|nr:hypothetical protein F8B43_0660 [Methylorubrum populi]